MNFGRMNRRVVIQARDLTAVDSFGQPLENWLTFAEVWAEFVFTSGVRVGMEAVRAGQLAAKPPATWRIRYRRDITEAMRLVDGATVYSIQSVLPNHARQDVTDLICEVSHA